MNKTIYLLACLIILVSCQQSELPTATVEECVLEFASVRTSRSAAAAVSIDPELAVALLDGEGTQLQYFAPGTVPSKLVLYPGTFIVKAYTLNADTWQTANGGKGEPYYYAETTVVLEEDHIARVNMAVPMQNSGVGLQMPVQFASVFPSYTFSLTLDGRDLTLQDGEKVFFEPTASSSFSYTLSATNADGASFSTTPAVYSDVQAGKLYMVCYDYEYNLVASVRVEE